MAPTGSDPRPSTLRRARRLVALLACVLLAATALVSCGDDDGGGSGDGGDPLEGLPTVEDSEYQDATGEEQVTVDVRDDRFVPQYLTISAGTEVSFDASGRNPHNVIAVVEGAFEDIPVDELPPGAVVGRTFDEPGDYPYYCTLHGTPTAGMTGRLRVVE